MKNYITILTIFLSTQLIAQVSNQDTLTNEPWNSAQNIIDGNMNQKVSIGVYGQVDYNQPLNDTIINNGTMDVHRLVMFLGYEFNQNLHFVGEVEFEHVKELYVEQAFLNYRINDFLNIKTGLLLIPMGIINEYHEPVTFNGVERPNLDNKIVPTTWREIGAGITGKFNDIGLRYQLYIVNGFNGYDGSGKFNGSDGLRNGRQKGAQSYISSPIVSGKIDYYGILGLKIGIAAYKGASQSTLFNNVNIENDTLIETADSSSLGITMLGFDVRYAFKGINIKGQYIHTLLSNASEYNLFTGGDIGSGLNGFYLEISYNIFQSVNNIHEKLIPFIRFEKYNTHFKVDNITKNKAYDITEITYGLGYKISDGVVFKADMQLMKNKSVNKFSKQLNFGIGFWF